MGNKLENTLRREYYSKRYINGDVLNSEDINNLVNGIDMLMSGEDTKIKCLHHGELVLSGYNAAGLDDTPKNRIAQHDAYAIPTDYETTFTYYCDDPLICMGIRHGERSENLTEHIFWLSPGDTFTLPITSKYYRCCWGHNSAPDASGFPDKVTDTTSIFNVEIMYDMIKDGRLGVYYTSHDTTNVIDRNQDSENIIKALMIDRVRPFSRSMRNGIHNYATICHTSDTHGDYERVKNFFEFSKYINADFNFITGDVMGYTPKNGNRYIDNLDEKYGKGGTCITLGNHDTYYLDMTAQYENSIKPLETRNTYVCNNTPYYYKDDSKYKLRIVAISPYDYKDSAYHGTKCVLSQGQIDWFINTLATTPAGYGVCVLMHPPMTSYENVEMQNKYWQHYKDDALEPCPVWESFTGISGQPIIDIVDAFISKTVISGKTFTNAEDNSTVTINADFSNVANNVEFIGHFNGHTHCDAVGYYKTAKNPQVVFNVCCGVATYGTSSYPYWANVCDVPRGLTGKSQDAFNVYVIDRENHVIRCGRVGSSTIINGKKRDFMTIDYKNKVIAE